MSASSGQLQTCEGNLSVIGTLTTGTFITTGNVTGSALNISGNGSVAGALSSGSFSTVGRLLAQNYATPEDAANSSTLAPIVLANGVYFTLAPGQRSGIFRITGVPPTGLGQVYLTKNAGDTTLDFTKAICIVTGCTDPTAPAPYFTAAPYLVQGIDANNVAVACLNSGISILGFQLMIIQR